MRSKPKTKVRCEAILKSGQQCKGWVTKGGKLCSIHDPRNAVKIREGRKKGGRLPRTKIFIEELKEIKDLDGLFAALNGLVKHIYMGAVSPKQGQAVISALAGIRATLIDLRESPKNPAASGMLDLSLLDDDELAALERISLKIRRLPGYSALPYPAIEAGEEIQAPAVSEPGNPEQGAIVDAEIEEETVGPIFLSRDDSLPQGEEDDSPKEELSVVMLDPDKVGTDDVVRPVEPVKLTPYRKKAEPWDVP